MAASRTTGAEEDDFPQYWPPADEAMSFMQPSTPARMKATAAPSWSDGRRSPARRGLAGIAGRYAGQNLPAAMSARLTRVTTQVTVVATLSAVPPSIFSGMPVSALIVIASW
jgi:hypothetical protein